MPSILVVDDDRLMVRTLCDLLHRSGWDAHGTHSGEEALAAAVNPAKWSVVLMDVRMAGMNGVEVLKSLRRSGSDVPVVLMTAYSATELLAEAAQAGAERVLAKPIPPKLLLDVLESVLVNAARVLVIDDDPVFLRTLSDLLVARGVRPATAGSLEAALERLRGPAPRLILLDLMLNGGDPRAAIVAIRQAAPDVPLVLYSGHRDELAATTSMLPREWFRAVLEKPIAPNHLFEILDDPSRR